MGWLSFVFAAAAGVCSTVQAGANAQLRKSLDQPLLAAVCVYGTGLLALLVAVPFVRFTGDIWSKAVQAPWWAWFGGLLSIVATMAGLMLARRMGSAPFTSTMVTSSLICSVLLDHLGWIGFEIHRATPWRLVGCGLLLGGLFLITKF
jgi:transporter family-2 protein